jgi:hypothetical protein
MKKYKKQITSYRDQSRTGKEIFIERHESGESDYYTLSITEYGDTEKIEFLDFDVPILLELLKEISEDLKKEKIND